MNFEATEFDAVKESPCSADTIALRSTARSSGNHQLPHPLRPGRTVCSAKIFGPLNELRCSCLNQYRASASGSIGLDACGIRSPRPGASRSTYRAISTRRPVGHIWYFQEPRLTARPPFSDIKSRTRKVLYFAQLYLIRTSITRRAGNADAARARAGPRGDRRRVRPLGRVLRKEQGGREATSSRRASDPRRDRCPASST